MMADMSDLTPSQEDKLLESDASMGASDSELNKTAIKIPVVTQPENVPTDATPTQVEVVAENEVDNEAENEAGKKPKQKKRMCGGLKKKIRKTMKDNAGMTKAEAVEILKKKAAEREAVATTANMNDKHKRNRSENMDTSEPEPKKPHVAASPADGKTKSFRDAVKSVRVGIIPTNFPTRKLVKDEVNNIKRKILKLVAEQRGENNIKPRFTDNPVARAGWLKIFCADESTAVWLKSLDYWREENYKVVDECDFPAETFLLGHFGYSNEEETATIFGVVEAQNDVSTAEWREVTRKDVGSMVFLTFAVDPVSLEQLQELNFCVEYGFGQVINLKKVDDDVHKAKKGIKSIKPEKKMITKAGKQGMAVPSGLEKVTEKTVNQKPAGSGKSEGKSAVIKDPKAGSFGLATGKMTTAAPSASSTPKGNKGPKKPAKNVNNDQKS